MITDAMVEAAAIADRYGIIADNDQQRLVRKRLYAEGKVCPDTSFEVPTEDCGTVLVRGKDHWRMVLEAADRAAWQPIETAPKDGTRFLFTNGTIVGTGLMIGHTPHFAADSWQGSTLTHWRPLPEPQHQ